jgi:CRP-like cAMP-binding protein
MAASDRVIPADDDSHYRGQNRLLAALSAAEYQRLLPNLDAVVLTLRQPLYEPGETMSHDYFPAGSMISLLSPVVGCPVLETAVLGKEGMLGLPIFLRASVSSARAMCQVAGGAMRMPAAAFREAVATDGPLPDLLHRYTQALFNAVAQTAACNRRHSTDQRCARWLLATHDAVDVERFPFTHEFLGLMLGLRRASVTDAVGRLRQAGAIDYRHGTIVMVDEGRLEAAACGCYRRIKGEFDRLLGRVSGVGAEFTPDPSNLLSPFPWREKS